MCFFIHFFILLSVFINWCPVLGDANSSFTTIQPVEFCGSCGLTDTHPELFLTVNASDIPAFSTIYVITNPNGTTTSTYFNDTASRKVMGKYGFHDGEYLSTGSYANEMNTIKGIIDATLTFATVSFYGNGTSTCVGASADINVQSTILFGDDIKPAFSSLLSKALSGQPVPPSCHYEPLEEPTYQIPAQFLTTTVQVNNLPALQTPTIPISSAMGAEPGSTAISSNQVPSTTPIISPTRSPTNTRPSDSGSGGTIVAEPPSHTSADGVVIDSQTPGTGSTVVVSGTTLVGGVVISSQAPGPGPTVIISGTTLVGGVAISSPIPSPGSTVVVSGTTFVCPTGSGPGFEIMTAFGGGCTQQNTAILSGESPHAIVIEGQTLMPSSAIILSGTTISLDASGSAVVVGGTTTIALQGPSTSAIVLGSQTLTIATSPGTRLKAFKTSVSIMALLVVVILANQ